HRVYVVGSGGSSPIGCLGYAVCAREIVEQSREMNIDFRAVIIPNGSSGTHAGLAAGYAAMGLSPRCVPSYTLPAPCDRARATTLEKACATLALLDGNATISPAEIDVDEHHRGAGYGIPTDEMLEAVRLLARSEGLLLDPVYGGKAFAGLLSDIKNGFYHQGDNVLFIMTGGTPALFAYRAAFQGEERKVEDSIPNSGEFRTGNPEPAWLVTFPRQRVTCRIALVCSGFSWSVLA